MQHMKEQGKNISYQTNGEEIGSLPEKEFRVMILKMIQNLGNRMAKDGTHLGTHIEKQKKNEKT